MGWAKYNVHKMYKFALWAIPMIMMIGQPATALYWIGWEDCNSDKKQRKEKRKEKLESTW